MPHPRKREKLTEEQFHQEALRLYREAVDVEKEERDQCVQDILFTDRPGSQWDEYGTLNRGSTRPKLENNRVALARNVYLGDLLQNEMSIKFRPTAGGSTRKTAEVYDGLARNVLNASNWDSILGSAAKEQCTGGIGAWGVTTEMADDDTFGQQVRVRELHSAATSVYPDLSAKKANAQDMNNCFVTELIPRTEFKERWPDATASGVDDATITRNNFKEGWFEQDRIRIAEYWVRTKVKQTLVKLEGGKTVLGDNLEKITDELTEAGNPPQIIESREVTRHKVQMYVMSGNEFLEPPADWLGQRIPIVIFYGYSTIVDGHHYYQGMIRKAKDPQRVYNWLTSTRVELMAKAPLAPWWYTDKQAAGKEHIWERMRVENSPMLPYNVDPEAPGPPVQSQVLQPQVEIASQLVQASEDIQSATGKFNPSLGDNDRSQSGIAIRRLNQAGDQATFELLKHTMQAITAMGEIFADIFPQIYQDAQIVMVLGADGMEDFVPINQVVFDDETQQEVLLHDVAGGKYGAVVGVGPSFATKRTESTELLASAFRENPELVRIAGDLWANSLDAPFGPELTERMRKIMLAQGIVEPTKEEKEKIDAQQQEQGQQEQGPSHEEMLQAGALDTIAVNNLLTEAKTETEKAKAESERSKPSQIESQTLKNITDSIENRSDAIATAAEGGFPVPAGALEAQAEEKTLRDILDDDAGSSHEPEPAGADPSLQ